MTRPEVHDLKYGSGEPLEAGDTIELQFAVAASLDLLDTGDLIQSSWRRGRPVVATIGTGAFRSEIDQFLVGLPTGSDRRLLVHSGTWPDVPTEIAISLSIFAIVSSAAGDVGDAASEFESIAAAVPPPAPDVTQRRDRDLAARITEAIGRAEKHAQRLRLMLSADLFAHLMEVTANRLTTPLRFKINPIGSHVDGSQEVEMALVDAETVVSVIQQDG